MKIQAGQRHGFVPAAIAFFVLIQSVAAQFTFTTNNGAIIITGYTGSGPSVTIPAATNGYPVTSIGNAVFGGNTSVTTVSIPASVTNIGAFAFASSGLTGISISASVIGIGQEAFISCQSLTNISVAAGNPAYSSLNGVLFDRPKSNLLQYPAALVTGNYSVPGTVTNIAAYAFYLASGFASVTIPINVTGIGQDAFAFCSAQNNNYLQVYFQGNAPALGADVFFEVGFDYGVSVYDIPGTTGWSTFSSAVGSSLQSLNLWYLPAPQILNFEPSFGLHPGGRIGFTISWATNASVVVVANGNPSNPVWTPISTNVVTATTGTANFLDPQTKSFKQRYYRLQGP